jgi:hypothetical protein
MGVGFGRRPISSRAQVNIHGPARLAPFVPSNDGRRLRPMTLIDEFFRRCVAIHVARRINGLDVIETLADVMLFVGIPRLHPV